MDNEEEIDIVEWRKRFMRKVIDEFVNHYNINSKINILKFPAKLYEEDWNEQFRSYIEDG